MHMACGAVQYELETTNGDRSGRSDGSRATELQNGLVLDM